MQINAPKYAFLYKFQISPFVKKKSFKFYQHICIFLLYNVINLN